MECVTENELRGKEGERSLGSSIFVLFFLQLLFMPKEALELTRTVTQLWSILS